MSEKEYILVKTTLIRGNPHFTIHRRKIKCLGGENMKPEKPEMKFLDIAELPKAGKGRSGKDYTADFNKIPVGKMWIVPEGYASGATLRDAVKRINKEAKKELYKVTQRTEKGTENVTIYVLRLK